MLVLLADMEFGSVQKFRFSDPDSVKLSLFISAERKSLLLLQEDAEKLETLLVL